MMETWKEELNDVRTLGERIKDDMQRMDVRVPTKEEAHYG